MATRWGIVSTGRISYDFVTCLRSLDATEHQVVAVAGRSIKAAKEFASVNHIKKAYGSYIELSQDTDVEVAYIGNPNHVHFATAKHMLESGKHVICEKPMCMNLKETKQLIEIARRNKRFLMEGVWSRFFPAYDKLRTILSSGLVGRPNMVQTTFGSMMLGFDRIVKPELGGSVVLDVGIYTAQLCSLVYGGLKPEKIVASGLLNGEGVDEVVNVTLDYGNNRTAIMTLSARCRMYNSAVISGPEEYIRLLPPFHCPTHLETPEETFHFPLPKTIDDKFNYGNSEGLVYEAEEVRKCLLRGLLESPLMPLDESEVLAYIMEEIRKQLDVKFHDQ